VRLAIIVLPLALFGSYFVYSARREEEFMFGLFHAAYRACMRRSNMLLLLPWPNRNQ
jgi:protein-S-isoprenylcysteine O-methyltransferase Ste14